MCTSSCGTSCTAEVVDVCRVSFASDGYLTLSSCVHTAVASYPAPFTLGTRPKTNSGGARHSPLGYVTFKTYGGEYENYSNCMEDAERGGHMQLHEYVPSNMLKV